MDILLLRFDAPLMSFGGVMVDQHGVIERFPGTSLLAGLFGNAFGYRHRDEKELQALQGRIEYAARWDVSPEKLVDYHTVDLGQSKMCEPGWTTRGEPEWREGGDAARTGTHIRYRHYWANGVMTLAVALTGDGPPSTSELRDAILRPCRPLFIGRKTCLPAAPLVIGMADSPDVLSALVAVPRVGHPSRQGQGKMEACWPAHIGDRDISRKVSIYDQRDWKNQVHAGKRFRAEGLIEEAPR